MTVSSCPHYDNDETMAQLGRQMMDILLHEDRGVNATSADDARRRLSGPLYDAAIQYLEESEEETEET